LILKELVQTLKGWSLNSGKSNFQTNAEIESPGWKTTLYLAQKIQKLISVNIIDIKSS